MPIIEAQQMTDEALTGYDAMMIQCAITVKDIAPLAIRIWSDVLKELDRRGKVRLVSGSYDDIGNAIVQRIG